MSTFTKYLLVILIGLILLLTFTYSTDYIKINLPFSFSSNPFTFNSEKQNNSSESPVIPKQPINSNQLNKLSELQSNSNLKPINNLKPIPKEINDLKLQDDNKFFGLNMPKSSAFSLDYLSNKEEEQEKNFTFENFINNSDIEQQDKENIDNFLIDNNFTTNDSDNIDNKLFIQTEDYQMTENTHNAITNALRNI